MYPRAASVRNHRSWPFPLLRCSQVGLMLLPSGGCIYQYEAASTRAECWHITAGVLFEDDMINEYVQVDQSQRRGLPAPSMQQ